MTFTRPRYNGRDGSGLTTALAHLADDGSGADYGDRRACRCNSRVLALQSAASHGVMTSALLVQYLQRLVVCDGRSPPRLAQGLAVDHPRIDDVVQVGHGRGRDPGPMQPLGGAERDAGWQ